MENWTMNKVVKITLLFWIMKILATTLGETFGDFLSMTLNLGYITSLLITLSSFMLILIIQLIRKKFNVVIYWLSIIGTTTVGTEVSDYMDRTLGLGYMLGSLILFSGFIFVLILWYRTEHKINIYPVFKKREELFYWIAILFSNSLGTAFGDFLSDNLGLSYLYGALVTAGIILIVVVLHYYTKINRILLFWIAFIFTRPFGATFGDLLTKPLSKGGLELGTITASLITAGLLTIFITIESRRHSVRVQVKGSGKS